MTADSTQGPFTDQQLAWLERWLEKHRSGVERSFDRATLMWIIGGLTALGVVAFGVLWSEIGSVREEIRENRSAIVELSRGQTELATTLARIEAILDERLPRPE